MIEKPASFFKSGDIVDTPYDGRRQILRLWWYKDKFSAACCWMYEIKPPSTSSRSFEYGRSYPEDSVNQGLFITPLKSGLDLKQYKPTYPPTYQNSPYYSINEVEP